jgi:thiol-disulfide isomerase/thioredoxin
MKKIFIIPAAILFTLSACSDSKVAAALSEVQQTSTSNHSAGAPQPIPALPAFTIQDINGKPVNLQSFKGKKLFVNFWASWCPPCRAEMPSIEKLFQSIDTSKVSFVMLSVDDNFEKAKKFISRRKLRLPIYYPAENLPALFKVQGIPSTFIFNENGELMQRIDGADNYDSDQYRKLLQ